MPDEPCWIPEPWYAAKWARKVERIGNEQKIIYGHGLYCAASGYAQDVEIVTINDAWRWTGANKMGTKADAQAAATAIRIEECINACAGTNPKVLPKLVAACEEFIRFSELPEGVVNRGDYIRYQVKALGAARDALTDLRKKVGDHLDP